MSIKRRQLFEWNDQGWLPRFMTSWMTRMLRVCHHNMQNGRVWGPKVLELMQRSGENRIVDLCSGGGGPVLDMIRILEEDHGLKPQLTMTDLIPNLRTAQEINAQAGNKIYITTPINATDVPAELQGIRTVFSGFHHLKEDLAFRLLQNAFDARQHIFISETTYRSVKAMVTYGLAFLWFFFLTPRIRPTFWQLIFTYLIPILPLMLGWDNVVSCLRTYSEDELRGFASQLQSDDYHWQIGELQNPRLPTPYPYIMGYPTRRATAEQDLR